MQANVYEYTATFETAHETRRFTVTFNVTARTPDGALTKGKRAALEMLGRLPASDGAYLVECGGCDVCKRNTHKGV
jgi:hypothetical protein